MSANPVAVIVPALDEADRIAATVGAARRIAGVDLVVVVDDGSADDTATRARAAGATVARHPHRRGKAAAMLTGAQVVARADARDGRTRLLLFLDADLEASAAAAAALVPPVRAGAADMTVAVLPVQRSAGGGRGFVVRAAREGIRAATGFTAAAPLSGQRCLSRAAFEVGCPLAPGFGVETGLTIDLLRAGLRVREVDCELYHRVTGRDWRAQRHRLGQYLDVRRALWRRGIRRLRL